MKKKGKREKGKKEGKINSLIKGKGEMCGYFYSSLHPYKMNFSNKKGVYFLEKSPPPPSLKVCSTHNLKKKEN